MFCKKSYEKEKDLPFKTNFVCRKLHGYNLNKNPNIKKSLYDSTLNLGKFGKKMILKNIKNYEKKEKIFKEKENFIYNYCHSKPRVICNSWKFSNHIIKEFSRPPLDKIYSFAVDDKSKPKYMTKPFRRPKDNGDYFDKNIY